MPVVKQRHGFAHSTARFRGIARYPGYGFDLISLDALLAKKGRAAMITSSGFTIRRLKIPLRSALGNAAHASLLIYRPEDWGSLQANSPLYPVGSSSRAPFLFTQGIHAWRRAAVATDSCTHSTPALVELVARAHAPLDPLRHSGWKFGMRPLERRMSEPDKCKAKSDLICAA